MESTEIVKLLFERDESALSHIQTDYGSLIKSIAFNLLKSDAVAEECLNDTLMDIWNTIPPEKPKSIVSYACMIVRRRAIDRIRGERAQKRLRPEGTEYTDVYDELASLDDISDAVVEKMELTRLINGFLVKQSRKNREIFISRYYDFESVESIAARLGMSPNSVATRLLRMRNSLKDVLVKGGISL